MENSLNTGSPGRTRTSDQLVNSQPLYRLSYRGIQINSSLFDNAHPIKLHFFVKQFLKKSSEKTGFGKSLSEARFRASRLAQLIKQRFGFGGFFEIRRNLKRAIEFLQRKVFLSRFRVS